LRTNIATEPKHRATKDQAVDMTFEKQTNLWIRCHPFVAAIPLGAGFFIGIVSTHRQVDIIILIGSYCFGLTMAFALLNRPKPLPTWALLLLAYDRLEYRFCSSFGSFD